MNSWPGGRSARIPLVCGLGLLLARTVLAVDAQITVLDHSSHPLAGTAVVLEPATGGASLRPARVAVMDQRNLRFDPELLIVQTGDRVSFPNSDQVQHQVYSFSDAKKFELRLYAGKAYPPVLFDKAGLVTLGCNIHDSMIGYILVVDTPWFAVSDARGVASLRGLPAGKYRVRLWHPRQKDPQREQRADLALTEGANARLQVVLQEELRASAHAHGTDKSWEDY